MSALLSSKPPPPTAARITRDRYSLSTRWLSASVVRITVTGEIDASNADELRGYVFRRAANCRRLILDLADVNFFSVAAFPTLVEISRRCSQASVNWLLVPNSVVSRMLEFCDPLGFLPVAKS
jgi:anti-anti-sigma factor